MSDFPEPQLARGWVIGLYISLVSFFLWAGWHSRSEITAVLLFLALALFVTFGATRILSTSITAEGASQLTLGGRVQLRWEDVRQVRSGANGALTLKGDRGQIFIPCAFYHDFDPTWTWLARRLHRVWPTSENL